MQAVIDSTKGAFFRCLLENGDLLNVHKSSLPENAQIGSVIKINFELDTEATEKQQKLMKKS